MHQDAKASQAPLGSKQPNSFQEICRKKFLFDDFEPHVLESSEKHNQRRIWNFISKYEKDPEQAIKLLEGSESDQEPASPAAPR